MADETYKEVRFVKDLRHMTHVEVPASATRDFDSFEMGYGQVIKLQPQKMYDLFTVFSAMGLGFAIGVVTMLCVLGR